MATVDLITEAQWSKLELALKAAIWRQRLPLAMPEWGDGLCIDRLDGLSCIRMDPELAGVVGGVVGVDVIMYQDDGHAIDFDSARAPLGDWKGLAGQILASAMRSNARIDKHLAAARAA